jgi:hypothetical protein
VVKQDITLAQPGQWMCSQHCQNMQGLFVPEGTTFLVADAAKSQWLVDNEAVGNNNAVVLQAGQENFGLSARSAGQVLFMADKTVRRPPCSKTPPLHGQFDVLSADGARARPQVRRHLRRAHGEETRQACCLLPSCRPGGEFCANGWKPISSRQCRSRRSHYSACLTKARVTTILITPLMRAYPGETVEIRTLVGAHMAPHSFNMHGVKWLFEQDSPNSGYRSTQGNGNYPSITTCGSTCRRPACRQRQPTAPTISTAPDVRHEGPGIRPVGIAARLQSRRKPICRR